ncbi:unnamed protein product [Rotaria sp. Silwood1]|nr:unnamed protein product [Rotaria sp. Silwood1]
MNKNLQVTIIDLYSLNNLFLEDENSRKLKESNYDCSTESISTGGDVSNVLRTRISNDENQQQNNKRSRILSPVSSEKKQKAGQKKTYQKFINQVRSTLKSDRDIQCKHKEYRLQQDLVAAELRQSLTELKNEK